MQLCKTVMICGHSIVFVTTHAHTGLIVATSPKMAEGGVDPLSESLQKLDDELTCPVCTDHFKEPKVLPCLHYYCKTCIADLIKRAKGRPFNCPECRREVQASNNDANRYDSFL